MRHFAGGFAGASTGCAVSPHRRQKLSRSTSQICAAGRFCTAAALLAVFPALSLAQAAAAPQAQPAQAPAAQPAQSPPATHAQTPNATAPNQNTLPPAADTKNEKPEKLPRGSDRRRAAKLFLEAGKLFEKQEYEPALEKFKLAAELDPTNRNYALAAELTQSHAVTALIQAAAKDRIRGDSSAERTALEEALKLDPKNVQVTEHLYELGDEQTRHLTSPVYAEGADAIGGPLEVMPKPGRQSFHVHTDQRTAIKDVFKGFGIEATVDDSVQLKQTRLDIDDADFNEAMRALNLLTNSFYVPLDSHRVLVAKDSADNRKQYERLDLETIYLPGLSTGELTEVGTLAKNVFELTQATPDPSAGTITVRGPASTLKAFDETLRELIDGHNQVLLEVTLIQLAHTSDRTTGLTTPQSISAYNVYSEEQSILNANQSLVQQIISSGLAAPGDTLAILGILLASGQVSSSLFTNGAALFGGGLTASAFSTGGVTANLSLNSSDSRELEHMVLRLSDGSSSGTDAAAGTIKSGTRYPIQTSSFSGLSASLPNIPGLTGAGSSSSLSSLLSQLGGSVPNVPQVEYQDLGLTLKATPKVMRDNDVALNIDLKIVALAGGSINGNPILTNRAYSGIVTVKQNTGVVLVSELDKQETKAISGLPGISEIPGLNNVSNNDAQKNSSTLLIVMTPHVIRGTQAPGHSPMMRVEHAAAAR
jgi:general secretion pathway protein D